MGKTLQQRGLLRTYEIYALSHFIQDPETPDDEEDELLEEAERFCILETIFLNIQTHRAKKPGTIFATQVFGPYHSIQQAHKALERFRASWAQHLDDELRRLIPDLGDPTNEEEQ